MTRKQKLEALRQAKLAAAREAEAEAKKLRLQIAKEAQKEARRRQARIGRLADDAGLGGVSLETFAAVFALLAQHGSADVAVQEWVEVITEMMPAEQA